MIQEKQKLSGILKSKESLNGSLSNSVIYVEPITQEKTIFPTAEQQIVTPDENYTGLSKVTVEAIQDDNLIPENIKNGVDILGVTGNFIGSKYAPRYITFYNYQGKDLTEETANLDTSNITDMSNIFYGNKKLHDIDISAWNTSNVTNMQNAFYNCNAFNSNTTLDFSNWVTSKVTNMSSMFYGNISVDSLDLSSFVTSEVTSVAAMFRNCTSLSRLDIRNFTFEKCTTTGNMLYGVKTNCLIIVKSQTEKDFILNIRNDLTNVKTVAELETSE